MAIASLTFLRNTISQQTSGSPWLLQPFHLLYNVSWALGARVGRTTEVLVVSGYHIGHLFSAYLLVMFFCNGLHLQPPSLRLLDTSDSILTVRSSALLHIPRAESWGWIPATSTTWPGLVSWHPALPWRQSLLGFAFLLPSLGALSQALPAWYLTVASYLSP